MQPLSSKLTNIIHETAQKLLTATVDIIDDSVTRAQKQGDQHLTHTKQGYEESENVNYHAGCCALWAITVKKTPRSRLQWMNNQNDLLTFNSGQGNSPTGGSKPWNKSSSPCKETATTLLPGLRAEAGVTTLAHPPAGEQKDPTPGPSIDEPTENSVAATRHPGLDIALTGATDMETPSKEDLNVTLRMLIRTSSLNGLNRKRGSTSLRAEEGGARPLPPLRLCQTLSIHTLSL